MIDQQVAVMQCMQIKLYSNVQIISYLLQLELMGAPQKGYWYLRQ